MIELTYHQFYRRAAEMRKLRSDMVRCANEHGGEAGRSRVRNHGTHGS